MHVSFEHCGRAAHFQLGDKRVPRGPLRCEQCAALISDIDVRGAGSWIAEQVARKRDLSQSGRLATRKQSTRRSDEEIDRDGLSAELAACALQSRPRFAASLDGIEQARRSETHSLPR
jgi:hypothetical protein